MFVYPFLCSSTHLCIGCVFEMREATLSARGNFFPLKNLGKLKNEWKLFCICVSLSLSLSLSWWVIDRWGVEMCLFFLYKNPLFNSFVLELCWKTTSKSMKHFFFVQVLSSILSRLGFLMHFKSDLRDLLNSSYIFLQF